MPRLVTEQAAAAEIGVEVSLFRHWVETHRLPGPLPECNKWDMRAIEAALDRLSGIGAPENALDAWRASRRRDAGG